MRNSLRFVIRNDLSISGIIPVDDDHTSYMKNKVNHSFSLFPTDPMEVRSLILSFSTHKAMGPDSISNKMLKTGVVCLSLILSDLINESFRTGIFPQSL